LQTYNPRIIHAIEAYFVLSPVTFALNQIKLVKFQLGCKLIDT